VAVIEQKLAGTKAQLEKARNAAKATRPTAEVRSQYQGSARQDFKYRDQSLDVKTNEQYKPS